MYRAPVICVSHGGGPLPILGDPNHGDIVASLSTRVPRILGLGTPRAPRAIIVVTAHWLEGHPTISSAPKHELYYDYYNFPEAAYSLKYDAPGSPEVAAEIRAAMLAEGLQPKLDAKRGWDHGVFIPFLLINPAADIPIVQVSVLESEDPAAHFRMGAALSKLRDSNVAIVGSGFASFHNLGILRRLRAPTNHADLAGFRARSDTWNVALSQVVSRPTRAERLARLRCWRGLPHSFEMHPSGGGEHFMPLLRCE
ncbi:unnamed protein product [Parascedosporium putredinis]|uniref:Extradiol ring-cleavage dioxygenase class III enzyme subunit B domain-containing protein n=1 Tax=Parascedosporium putredinis TaxID=1442378 RepID=A0A9P1GY47_9PEZI|nr:unnamed protein product [Parascedosporium putredinis]CAI7990432.1 unnamed protein product [Parascedosporium putredinis]